MHKRPDALSPQERSLLRVLQDHGQRSSGQPWSTEFWELLGIEVRGFFHRLSREHLARLFESLCRKGWLVHDNDGGYRLAYNDIHTDIGIVGRITAGTLREAWSDELGFVRFEGRLQHPETLFALEVDGLSMIEDDIHDGDCVLLRRADVFNGQIGAVIVNGETTLKRIYREPGGIRLVPSNTEYVPIFIPAHEDQTIEVLGRLEAVIEKSTGHVRWATNPNVVTEFSLFLN